MHFKQVLNDLPKGMNYNQRKEKKCLHRLSQAKSQYRKIHEKIVLNQFFKIELGLPSLKISIQNPNSIEQAKADY